MKIKYDWTELLQRYNEDLKKAMESKIVKDPALFWAGKMSDYIGLLEGSRPDSFSGFVDILVRLKQEYDSIIFGRVK